MCINSAFAVGSRKATESLDLVGRSYVQPNASQPAVRACRTRSIVDVSTCAAVFLLKMYRCVSCRKLYLCLSVGNRQFDRKERNLKVSGYFKFFIRYLPTHSQNVKYILLTFLIDRDLCFFRFFIWHSLGKAPMRWASPDALGSPVSQKKPYNCSSKIYWGWRALAVFGTSLWQGWG